MSQLRSQPMTGGVSRRRTSSAASDRRASITTPPPLHGPPTQSYNRRVTSVTTNYRDGPKPASRPQSSERLIPARKTPTNVLDRTEQPPKQLTRHDQTGKRKSPRNKRPPFVVGTGSSTAYRGGNGSGVGCRPYATTKTESHSRFTATSSKDRRGITGTEMKLNRSERPAVHATETMTLISNSIGNVARQSRDRDVTPDVTESSATVIVADPLPEVFLHRTNRKQQHPSADECIKQVAEKLSEFAAFQKYTSTLDAVKSESNTGLNGGQRPNTGNDVMTDTRRCDVTKSPPPPPLAQDGHSATIQATTISGGNDVSSAPKRVGGTSKKAAEVHRNGLTRLTATYRPSPTRSSLLRQALNCPGTAASQHRVPRPTKPTVGRSQRSATELNTENHLQPPLRQHSMTKQGRVNNAQTAHDAAALPRNAKYQTSRRFGGDHVVKPADCASAAATRELRDPVSTTTSTKRLAGRRSVDAESSRTYNVDGGSSTQSSLSTPRTYVVEVLPETDDESSRQTSPRIARSFRRRRPKSLDNIKYSRLSISPLTKDGDPEVEYSSHRSSSTETFVCTKTASLSAESLRRRRRRSNTTSPNGTAVVGSSTPNIPEIGRPLRHRRSSISSEGEVIVPCGAERVGVQVPCREDADNAPTKKSIDSDHPHMSRLPRLVTRPQDTLPSTSSVSATVVRAPRPRSFRYSRLHRRAVDALVPPPLRDMPWHWAWKASTDVD